ncbi:MAG: DNA repair protein RecN [Deltaproteobacteria bacterium]|nr:DNA repair protein RecN [Deltaproteobacteria bacterium]MBW1952951.1 DNA repair protein RecN [Deltaproteobacteria bacterium]MBW1986693.1 DNA repair protein RecN [Deltaproteobacteria bacterium]MBW2134539.1 DNA repair protein RecN [Deltaproteobacteria bacterium]
MLTELRIKNLAILDQVKLELEPGLNILSGETGAGKSMIIQAVHLLLGARGSEELIRNGAQEAEIEARFWVPPDDQGKPGLAEMAEAADGEVLLRRLVNRSGRSRGYLNDQAVTLKYLTNIGRELLSLSGQHEYQVLLAPENHLAILDAYGGLNDQVGHFRSRYQDWQQLKRDWQQTLSKQQELTASQELLAFQLQELEQAQIAPAEDETLARERERLRHASQLFEETRNSYDRLYAGKTALLGMLSEIQNSLNFINRIDPAWQTRLAELENIHYQLEDLALALRDYLRTVQMDPQRLQEVDHRLALLERLKRKYGPTLQEVLAFQDWARQEVARLDDFDSHLQALKEQLVAAGQELSQKAQELSQCRQAVAQRLAAAVETEIHSLAMPQARFTVFFQKSSVEAPGAYEFSPTVGGQPVTATGCDRVEFYLAPNPGEPPKPLARIASGGELSRLVLGLKNILAQEAGVETVVFDEVDTGIGGAVAQVVGQKLHNLAKKHQIICITHLPQIACFGDCHFRVEKQVQDGRTVTTVTKLTATERLKEIARMLGGTQITDTTLAHAQELLALARQSQPCR